jgi:Arm DNA-binding domain
LRVALTDRFVAAAKASTRAEFFDARMKGLSLRVSPTAKTWAFHFTATDGKRARLTLGSFPAVTLAAARGLALEAQAAVQSGQDPRMHKAGGMTVVTLVANYLAKHVRSLRSAKEVERRLRKNVLPIIGNVRLADLHRRDVNRVLDQIMCSLIFVRCYVGRSLAATSTVIRCKACTRHPRHAVVIEC